MYIDFIRDTYEGSGTNVNCICGVTENFNVRAGVHQGSALSRYLFSVVMDEITKEIQDEIPWCMVF